MRPFAHWIVSHSRLVLLLGAAFSGFFALHLPNVRLDPSAQGIMVENDPARVFYDQFKQVFGSDSMIAIAIRSRDTVFRPALLAKIKAMAGELQAIDGVERVLSLATTDNLGDCREGLKPGPVYSEVPTTPEALAEVERLALANHTFVSNLVSSDRRTAGLIVFASVPTIDRYAFSSALREALARGEPLAQRLVADLLYSSTFAAALRAANPGGLFSTVGEGAMPAMRRVVERNPEEAGRAALELLRQSRRLHRTAVREALAAARTATARLVAGVEQVIARHSGVPGEEIYQIGNPVMLVAASTYQREDLSRLLPCTFVLVAIVCYATFRSLKGVVMPLATVVLSVVWTFGLMGFLDVPLSIITCVVGPLLIALGNSYAIHVVAHYDESTGPEREPCRVVERALEGSALPILLCGVTTIVGFLSNAVTPLSSIREFAVYSSFGILAAMVISVTIVPAALCHLPLSRDRRAQPDGSRVQHADLTERFLRAVGRFDAHHPWAVAGIWASICLVSAAGCLLLEVDTNYMGFFRVRDRIRTNAQRMHEELSGAVPLCVVLDARGRQATGSARSDTEWRGPFSDPELLRFQLQLQGFMATLRLGEGPDAPRAIDKSVSFADHVKLMYQSYMRERTQDLPDTRAGVEALLDFFYKREDAEKYVSADFAQANIYVRTHTLASRLLRTAVQRIEDYARTHAPAGVEVRVTGETILVLRAADAIAWGQINSLGLAFAVILVMMGLLFMSVKAGLLSIIPNAVPILVTFGVMGLVGENLNSGTTLVASIALGIAVDDTIHYMIAFNQHVRQTGDRRRAMLVTLFLRGRAMIFTSVALIVGFMVLVLSRFAPIVAFGYLTALAMFVGISAEVLITPVLMANFETITLWDMLVTRLPGKPSQWLGVLRGLTRAEAKRVVALCTLRRVARGNAVLRRGTDGAREATPIYAEAPGSGRVYAILEGQVELRTIAGTRSQPAVKLGRGDLFAEATLAARGGQLFDAIASEDAQLLSLDEGTLQRLARRAPRAAAKLLRNLAFGFAEQIAARAHPHPAPGLSGGGARPFAQPNLFHGLTPSEESLIRSLAETRSYEAGAALSAPSQMSRALLAVLAGHVAVCARNGPRDTREAELGPGALLPELGSASAPSPLARAIEAAQVMVVDDALLERLTACSPRTAARWTLNLARILQARFVEAAHGDSASPATS